MPENLKIYQASAGSGKTFNLARVFIALLLAKTGNSLEKNLRATLAITFTKKAANEMKERVLDFLKILVGENEKDNQLKLLLLNDIENDTKLSHQQIIERASILLRIIMENYSDLSIGTIDSFNQRIVRSFARDLGVHFEFDISLNKNEWLDMAIDRLFERFGDKNKGDELTSTLIDFFVSQIEEESENTWNLKYIVKKFSSRNFNDRLYDLFEKHPKLKDFNLSEIKNKLQNSINTYSSEIKQYGSQGLQLIKSVGLSESDFYQTRSGIYPFFENASMGNKIFDLPNSYVIKALNDDVWTKAKPSAEAALHLPEIKTELHEILSKLIAIKRDGQKFRINDLILKQIHFMSLTKFIKSELESLKEEENTLLIDDFNRLIDKVVKNEPIPFIYERIGERYKHYLIDEFQDTAIKQWHNFIPLIDNSLAAGKQNLIVGDGKQAIYRFRDGEVEIFNQLPKIYQSEGELYNLYQQNFEREFKLYSLENNYRSRKEIVDFNNLFYESLKINLGENDGIYERHQQNPIREKGGYVRIEILDKTQVKEEDAFLTKTLAAIKESVEDGFLPGEIAVLARKGDYLKAIAEHLSEHNITIESSESLTLKNQEGIQFLIYLLKYILNPDDKVVQYWLYFYLINKFDNNPNLSLQKISKEKIPIKEKLLSLDLAKGLKQASSLPLYQMVIELEKLFSIGISLSAYFKTFLDLIEIEDKKGMQLDGFLERWEEINPSISTPNNPNAVKLLTIHKAKGLEFPVVIFPFSDWEKRMTKKYKWVDSPIEIADELPKVLLKLNDSILSVPTYNTVYSNEKSKSLLDDINLIYVATTRPTERLYLFTSNDTSKGKISSEIQKALHSMDMGDENSLEFGTRISRPKQDLIVVNNDLPLEKFATTYRSDVINIAYEFKKYRSESQKRALDYGKTIHQILSEIETKHDLKSALNHALQTGFISTAELKEINAKIIKIFDNKQVNDWFGDEGEKIKERDLIDNNGNVLRPDRIVITDQHVWVIDYKTGTIDDAKIKKYSHQVLGYVEALKNMNYQNVSGYILAIDKAEVIRV